MLILFLIWVSGTVLARKKSCDVLSPTPGNPQTTTTDELAPPHSVVLLIDSISHVLQCRIKIKEAPIRTTLNVRPSFKSLFVRPENRQYIIRVNNSPKFKGIYNHEVPQPALDGLWVHELMHIKDYQSRSTFGILKRGAQYLTMKGRRMFEHEIDRMVVNEGYGEALYHWANFIMYESWASDRYKLYKQSVYLSPMQIKSAMNPNVFADAD
ncbi:MAG: hypothetical protein QM786_13170 [Breznakibacter sp.]